MMNREAEEEALSGILECVSVDKIELLVLDMFRKGKNTMISKTYGFEKLWNRHPKVMEIKEFVGR
jgi:hypothetical protein